MFRGMLLLMLLASGVPSVADVLFTLTDDKNLPVANFVLLLEPKFAFEASQGPGQREEIRQQNRQFFPHISVVQKGAEVTFPNLDDIKHHVFSFSPTKVFELQLYESSEYPPIVFDVAGEVQLGCNVHDWMLAYVLVVDSPFYGKTDKGGLARLPDMPLGDYRLSIWHPLIDNPSHRQQMDFTITGQASYSLELSAALSAPLAGYEDYVQSEDY